MSNPPSLDRETLQQLLANAFAVQESRINTQSLSAIMEVQRSVASGKLDLDGAMAHIVESARNVANATGVAIALLKGDQLTYRAGSGSSAACTGRQVTASLTVSADAKTNCEILRVENAQTDTRIEADICRQFGASALLILPIYHDRVLAGVLDVRFSEAHAFQDPEVRTYRLMAEQIEAALFHAAQLEQKKNLAADLPPIPDTFEQITPPDEALVPPPEFMMLPQNEHSLYARCVAVLADIMELPVFKQSALLATTLTQRAKNIRWPSRQRNSTVVVARKLPTFKHPTMLATMLALRAKTRTWLNRWRTSTQAAARELSSVFKQKAFSVTQRAKTLTWPNRWRTSAQAAAAQFSSVFKRTASSATMLTQRAKNLNWPTRRRNIALTAVAVVLAFTLIAYRGRGPAKSWESSTLPSARAIDQTQVPKPLPGKVASAVQTVPVPPKGTAHARTALRRVRVGPNEVDYIGEDVTVRTFTDRSPAKRTRVPAHRIAHIGDDVTVRYFTPSPPTTKTASR
ncbi:MAG: GAF domain-containing protein [Candidatus Sulfotelmatobacter sp.]